MLEQEKCTHYGRSAESDRMALVSTVIQNHDQTLVDEAMTIPANSFYNRVCRAALAGDSIPTLQYIVDRGVSVKHLMPRDLVSKRVPSKEILEFLLAHGWDINWRSDDDPFMWRVTSNHDMAVWCLEHGASVHPNNDATNTIQRRQEALEAVQGLQVNLPQAVRPDPRTRRIFRKHRDIRALTLEASAFRSAYATQSRHVRCRHPLPRRSEEER